MSRETELRVLSFFWELSDRPKVADALADAATAVMEGALDDGTADMLVECWRPLARLESITRPLVSDVRARVDQLRRELRSTDDLDAKSGIAAQLRDECARLRELEGRP
jgi:hypothetical protein